MYLLLPTERVSKAEKCPKLCRLISNKLSVEPAIIILSWLRCRIRSGGSATDPKLARLSLRLALVTGLRRSLSVSWLLPGMFSLPVRSAAHVERFLAEGTSTHWPKGTPKTGPGPGWPLDSRDLSETKSIYYLGISISSWIIIFQKFCLVGNLILPLLLSHRGSTFFFNK